MAEQVWIIDDDKSMRWVLEKALNQAGFTTTTFSSGEEALAALSSRQPNVMITDIRMQGMDGLALLAMVHKRYPPHLPVIVMTAHSDLDSAVKSYQSGAFEYLPKPFDLDDAVALVRRALAHSPRSHSKHRLSYFRKCHYWRSAGHAGGF